jgi:aryl-alcohol dehydrogenase-like predicted oxidoreductase
MRKDMNKRKLGDSNIEVGPLALGGNVFGWTADETTSFKILDAFVGGGLNLIDTADVYSRWVPGHKGGESETIIGNWLKRSGARQKVVIATKVGMEMDSGEKGLSKSYLLREAEASLRRLQTDYIDLYQSHVDDPNTPMEQTLEAYAHLKNQGKIRIIGASNFSAPRLVHSLELSRRYGFPRYQTLQPEYNLMQRSDYEMNLEPVCIQNRIGVITYFSLASGFLTGKYRSEKDLSLSPRGHAAQKYLNDRGFRVLAALDEVAKEYESTPSRVSLAWLIARPSVTAPIASATSLDQLNDLVEATRLKLKPSAIERLNHASI